MTMTATVEQVEKQQHAFATQSSQQIQQQQHCTEQNDTARTENTEGGITLITANRELAASAYCTDRDQFPARVSASKVLPTKAPTAKGKKPRRRRGGKGRWKPYHKLSLEEKIAKEVKEERNAVQKRERLFSRGKPMAPYNTTQFLLEDHEKRVTVDSDGDSVPGLAVHHRRVGEERCGPVGHSFPEMGGNTTDSASHSGAEDDEMERQFDADYDYVNLERIWKMTKEEVTREYLHLEKSNGKLADRVSMLQLENEKLKQLLKEHNIAYEDLLPVRRRSSGTSFSDAGDVPRISFDEFSGDNGGQ